MTRYTRGFIAALMLTVLAIGSYPATAATMDEMPSGTVTPVDTSNGNQTDPHIGGTLVAYTSQIDSVTEIRYHDLATGDSGTISGDGRDRLADVYGSTVVFTRTHHDRIAIHAFDAVDESTTELDPLVGSLRSNPSIGGSTVVWEDRGPVDAEFSSQELVVYDLVNENTTRLTDDSARDAWPAVNSDGSVIVWEKCVIRNSTGCDIWQAAQSGSTWTLDKLTSEGESNQPDTNGEVVVYQSTRDGETDIFWQPVGGGEERQLSLPGVQVRPNMSGDLIAFESESEDPDTGTVDSDILIYDLGSDTVYPITDTSDLKEQLPDISVGEDGVARVVYAIEDASRERNIHAFSFNLSSEDMTPPALILPGDISIDATSPDGVAAAYTVTAEDETDENPAVDCQLLSGSVFPIGTTSVICTAADDSGNQTEGSFTVTVHGADRQLDDLVDLIHSFDLRPGTENSLNVKLGNAAKALADGRARPACGMLGAFINSVEAQAGKKLTHEQANDLIGTALRIQAVAGCG